MFRYILCLMCLLFCAISLPVFAVRNSEPAVSTQGIELDDSIAKSKPSAQDKNEQKQNKNRSKLYIKNKKK